ncbi:MAG TPA: F0F1 ATP synthase subunit A [Deltaproteobacteria bacterium]|nr:F0F1 ATP synthase subunit A [Deltaproteobacteria bacterium]NMD41391.1 F0F1 ATP synthase subunit A [Deltaproteobacteria bacterium]HNQ85991.1 F0F1 ATP synthase subunit A [Deltaproteobacteria bacterium]HNS89249.1 F0F1 ATP synthase subunit A [Deltaproteobacteria bacterium]HOA44546.1 F0F1 ATP synthase subunit A [Deltaproteobacteria bacterium]
MEILRLNQISPDQVILFQWGFVHVSATLAYTWLIMGILLAFALLVGRRSTPDVKITRWQNLLEVVVGGIREQIHEISQEDPDHYMAFIGTLFLFIGLSNLLLIVPGYVAPTASLTTTAALAVTVFLAVPIYGISRNRMGYFREYFQPTFIFFPFHVMGELTRTLALAIRLFGNIMSHDKVIAILLAVTPLFFPVVMHALGLLIGMVQAYIFSILAMVYIASATQAHEEKQHTGKP